ncbi:antitoxin [Streptoalloteichus hindustanus]|uniref:MT0933-like antitoxin protein n=1 Tax=Streptoalloteichus hindustanus TaxID=2017 RepID=A0A1M4VM14_STRHI|nr:antitoxin [Streptoalloteichus hindustanus]SHE70084.1 MT0933-like antitoxin protein [Streptoalloteichus hindustanus]
MNFDELKKAAEGLLQQHGDKVEMAVEKVGELAKERFGHEEQIDQGVQKIKDLIPDGNDGAGRG